ncbi:GTP cyclohydrolase II [Limobrevibacterium gyesilva]|uniref:GTP cyclohydrolase-2 n=1 Tax=Limobrevibacterium gyesilva TaxID=2991712 RepID=A0AA42CEI0_9PROT|nr:GTP cyclohydrolase II [Limobrevibacterium gyesilva]MCW3473551.1 GTP cyclohydrolase II [Limobrevibacterium gyesilva]
MNHMPLRDDTASGVAETQPESEPRPDPAVLRLRAVHRAAAELKRGTPVLLLADAPLVVLPAETAGARGLREMAALAAGPAVLVLAQWRAAVVLQRPVLPDGPAVAWHLSPLLSDPAVLHSLADPTAAQILPEVPEPADCPADAPAALALTKLARLLPTVLVAPARPDAVERAGRIGLLTVPAGDVLDYPTAMAADLVRVAEARVPLDGAPDARIVAFRAPDAGIEHLAILVGHPEQAEAPLVRIHSECFTGDLLGSLRCDCGPQLRGAIQRMAKDGAGVLLYLAQEGRGIGLVNKLRAYTMQDRGLDTVDANRALGWGADERNFLIAATMLDELEIANVRLLTNNPDKVRALAACGVNVVQRERHVFAPNGINDHYLATKAERFGHLFG